MVVPGTRPDDSSPRDPGPKRELFRIVPLWAVLGQYEVWHTRCQDMGWKTGKLVSMEFESPAPTPEDPGTRRYTGDTEPKEDRRSTRSVH